MYRPKSPIANTKKITFSPSPVTKRKNQTIKTTPMNPPSPKHKPNPVTCENKPHRKTSINNGKRPPMKNIEVDTNELIESLKTNDCGMGSNQTPKFCLKPQKINMPMNNFFSFGEKADQNKINQQKKCNEATKQMKPSRSPQATGRKKTDKFRFDFTGFESSTRIKKHLEGNLR